MRTGPGVNAEALTVLKVGGGLAGIPGALPRVGAALARAVKVTRIVVIPGGGPFADAVRDFDRRVGVSQDAAHWMAILGMDQYGYAIASHTPGGEVIEEPGGIGPALNRGAVPVLAPSRWLRAADELPHRWEVTSDSLAAYLAGLLGADRLFLVKPIAGDVNEITDPYFARARPVGLEVTVLALGDIETLSERLGRVAESR